MDLSNVFLLFLIIFVIFLFFYFFKKLAIIECNYFIIVV